MRIVHYIPFIDKNLGGVPAYMDLLSKDLGHLCELHVITHYFPSDYHLENCTVHYIENNWYLPHKCKRIFLSLLKEIRPDVFHTNACWTPLTALTAVWAKEAGFPVVYTPHGELSEYSINRHRWKKKLAITLWQKRGIKSADIIHITSDQERKDLLKLCWNFAFCQIPNCIRIDEIEMKNSWKKTGRILFLSRIHHKKGVHNLIDAVYLLKDELKGYIVEIAGPGEDEYFGNMQKKVRNMGLSDVIRFAGIVFGEEKWKMYREADVFILPTLSENFGIVIPEALACGTPVITTKGAPWAELPETHCGWWVDIGVQPLANAIMDFLSLDEPVLEEMGKTGRKLVEDNYSSVSVAVRFIEMYKTLSGK